MKNETIVLRAEDAYSCSKDPKTLQGTSPEEHEYKKLHWIHHLLPEFGPGRLYDRQTLRSKTPGIVLPLGGRRYQVICNTEYDCEGIPSGATVTFIPTEKPETPFTEETPDSRIPEMSAFGQPRFIQNPVYPEFEGRCASNLLTIESGWGDAGNINILCALDKNGVPAKVWFEGSCC